MTGASRRVAVIGGSAAGFFTADLLARRGHNVQLFERAESLDPTPRTLIVTSHLRDVLGEAAEPSIVNEIRRFELFADGRVATVPLRRPDLVIERATLISSLAERARASGARVALGCRFVGLEPNGSSLHVRIERLASGSAESVDVHDVVGADGAFSRVAQAAGWPRQKTVPLVQAVVKWPAEIPSDTVRVWFIPEETPYFYWLIPESPAHGALGLIGEDGRATRICLERFLEKHKFTPLKFQAARIPVYERWTPVRREVGAGRVFLVGDAAGHVKVTTVGGIVTGFRGAVGVADAISNGGSSPELRDLRRELYLHLLVRRALHRFSQSDYCRLFDLVRGSAQEPLATYTRDEAGRMLWRLMVRQPRLLLMGMRALLTGSAPLAPREPQSVADLRTEPLLSEAEPAQEIPNSG